jgi:hypothetical protein
MSALPSSVRQGFRAAIVAAESTARLTLRLGTIEGLRGQINGADYLIAVSVLFEALPAVAQKWADDPPRDDFQSATRVLVRGSARKPS